ncbi:hypothetical protein MMC21_002926 [Puttea exsequens]|nr:hypothetical protein [Puttea exsequens]
MNVSATLNVLKLLARPSLCVPHLTVPTFDLVTLPVSKALARANGGERPDIRAVVLDKDNCFAESRTNKVFKQYREHFNILKQLYQGPQLLVVSNSAGTDGYDYQEQASRLEKNTGVKVFRHSTKKPGCSSDVFKHICHTTRKNIYPVKKPSQIAVIGDRLFTDVIMANMMGAWSIWIEDGVVKDDGNLSRVEKRVSRLLGRLNIKPPRVEDGR